MSGWFVQPRKDETEGRPHGNLQITHKDNTMAGADLFSLEAATRPEGMA